MTRAFGICKIKNRKKKMYVRYRNIRSVYSTLQRKIPVSYVNIFRNYYHALMKSLSTKKVKYVTIFSILKTIVVIDISKTDDYS